MTGAPPNDQLSISRSRDTEARGVRVAGIPVPCHTTQCAIYQTNLWQIYMLHASFFFGDFVAKRCACIFHVWLICSRISIRFGMVRFSGIFWLGTIAKQLQYKSTHTEIGFRCCATHTTATKPIDYNNSIDKQKRELHIPRMNGVLLCHLSIALLSHSEYRICNSGKRG